MRKSKPYLYICVGHNVLTDTRVMALSPATRWAWVALTILSAQHMTDGLLSAGMPALAGATGLDMDALETNGLVQLVEGGWLLVDFEKWQTTKQESMKASVAGSPTAQAIQAPKVISGDFHQGNAFKETWKNWPKHPSGSSQTKAFDAFCENVLTEADFKKLLQVAEARKAAYKADPKPESEKAKFTPSFISLCTQYKDVDIPTPEVAKEDPVKATNNFLAQLNLTPVEKN